MGVHNLVIALSALVAIALAWFDLDPYYGFAKALTTILVLVFFVRFVRDLKTFDALIGAIALLFCLGGDVALLFDDKFIIGLSSFLIGHVLIIALFSRLAEGNLSWLAVFVTFAIAVFYYTFISARLATEALPVAVYTTVIALMGAWGISLYLWEKSAASLLIMLGGITFMVSDGVLSYNRFVTSDPMFHPIVLSTYWLALALIVNGLAKIERR